MSALKDFRKWIFHCWTTFRDQLLCCWRSICETIRRLVHGAEQEEERVVVRSIELTTPWCGSIRVAKVLATAFAVLRHCSVHIIPIFATITISYLNLVGFFIGENLNGSPTVIAQDIDRLSLQVVAKLFELFIIASLGVVIMDAIRDKLLYGSEGVPLGLIMSQARFVDISFLLGHDFRAGFRGFQRKRTRWMFAVLIISCALVAIFVGPSTALLLIPVYYEAWPGGGASIWLSGDIQPTTLDVSQSWDARCTSVAHNPSLLNASDKSLASCPWAGFPYLSEILAQSAFSYIPLYYKDEISPREIWLWWGGDDIPINTVRMSATGSNIAAGAFAQTLSNIWCQAMWEAPQAAPGHRLANLHERARGGTIGNLESLLPLVRTECFNASYYVNLLEDRGLNMNGTLPFPVITDSPTPPYAAYLIPVNTSQARTISTRWITIPNGPSNTTYGKTTSKYPSAFLVIQNSGLPYLDSLVTCSVEAEWVRGIILQNKVCWGPEDLQGVLNSDDDAAVIDWAVTRGAPDSGVPDFKSATAWEPVRLTVEWLNVLTPALTPNATGYTTLASVLETLPQRDYPLQGGQSIFIDINAVVASFVVDGMSRVGYNENNVSDLNVSTWCTQVDAPPNLGNNQGGQEPCLWQFSSDTETNLFKDLLDGKLEMTPYPPPASNTGTRFRYYVTITGYGLKATSTANYLALTVLFVYVVIALGHITWTWCRGRFSSTWGSLTDFLVLSQTSLAPVGVLKNTSTGVESHDTLKIQVRIRNNSSVAQGQEKLQILFGKDGEDEKLEKVQDNEKYGAKT